MSEHRTKGTNKKRLGHIDKVVGSNLKRLRLLRGLSQQRLALKLGLTFQQVQKYESGKNRLSSATLYDACQILEVNVTDLFAGLDQPANAMLFDNITPRKIELLKAFDLMSPTQQKLILKILGLK